MKKKMINNTHIEGLLYEDKLEKKITGENSKNPGTEYITGTIDIATDDNGVNIVPVHFTYVTEKTAKGNTNATFGMLNNIIEGNIKTVMGAGKEAAAKVRVDSALGLMNSTVIELVKKFLFVLKEMKVVLFIRQML